MNVTINNFRGLASASLNINKICLLAGPNEAGKTSASQAFAAALTGDPVPIAGVKKTQVGMLVRSGTANGSVELMTEAGTSNIQWPSAKVRSVGQPPQASPFAVGLQSIVTMDEKERVKTLTEYLKATPTKEDLEAQLKNIKLSPLHITQLWDLIQANGWDNAAAQIKEKGAILKGRWQQATGEGYGSKKAESWIPEGYDNDLMGQSEETLQAIVTDTRDALEAAISSDAVDGSRRADLEAVAGLLPVRKIDAIAAAADKIDPAFQHQLGECEGFIASINNNKEKLVKQLAETPSPDQAKGMCCPNCKTELEVKAGSLHAITGQLSAEEIASRKELIDGLKSKIEKITGDIQKHMEAAAKIRKVISDAQTALTVKISECNRLVAESEAAAKELEKPAAPASTVSVDDCRTTLAQAEIRLKAYRAKSKADLLHVAIGENAELLAKIAPEGIRGDVLIKALKRFNDILAPICKAASWKPVTLESDFMPTYGGTIYLLLSESAKFRVRTILQMGLAILDKSQALIIDAADILDKGGRNGLFKAVKQVGLPCLISMTMDSKELVPDLAKAGIGASYWINGEAATEPIQ